jgi:hypothetical protein
VNASNRIPFDRSYWVVPGKVLAGAYPGSDNPHIAETKLEGLLEVGIRCVINLMEESEVNREGRAFAPYNRRLIAMGESVGERISCLRFPIQDMHVPSVELMRGILDEIDRSTSRNIPVFIHCWGGKGRTGTVVGCYLARRGIASGNEALKRITDLRKNDPTFADPSPQTVKGSWSIQVRGFAFAKPSAAAYN